MKPLAAAHVLVTCEHAGNRVPARYRSCLAGASRALASHRGWDPGAQVLARQVAKRLDAPLFATTVTRLLVDTNRSLGHRRLFSEWSRCLSALERKDVVERYWQEFRDGVLREVRAGLTGRGAVLHLSMHSFTPVFEGHRRAVDVGFLYDPARPRERALVDKWRSALAVHRPELRLRRNQPYRGTADGHTQALRKLLGKRYVGVELEVSQRFPRGAAATWTVLRRDLVNSLGEALAR